MNKSAFCLGMLVCSLGASTAAWAGEKDEAPASADPAAPAAGSDAAVKPPKSTLELGLTWVPLGVAYLRAGAGLSVTYERTPLVQGPGILWETTGLNIGVRQFFGFVNNTVGAFVEVTPIGIFKLQVYAGYDSLFVDPFSGGVRVLTQLGEQRLANGVVERGNPGAVDWVEGMDNREVFFAPVNGGGLRLQVMPTLQGKFGPVAVRYNFTGDFNFYRAGDYNADAIFHDTFTFTLRKLRDFEQIHEVMVGYDVPVAPTELLIGASGRYLRVAGTGLDSLGVNALLFCRPSWRLIDERLSFWGALQVGTNLIDPMHQYAFASLLVLGGDVQLF